MNNEELTADTDCWQLYVAPEPCSGPKYARIFKANWNSPFAILCDGSEATLRPLCSQLNTLTPRMLEILQA